MSDSKSSLLPDTVRGSYATRLGVALGLTILVMVLVGSVIAAEAGSAIDEDVETSMTTNAETQADELDAWLRGTRQSIRSTSNHPDLQSEDTRTAYLQELIETDQVPDGVAAVHYLNAETMTIEASSNDDFVGRSPAEQGAPFAEDPPSFDGPHDVHVSDPFVPEFTDSPLLAIISPVTGEDGRVLVYMIDLNQQAESVSERRAGTQTTVIGPNDEYVAHPNGSLVNEQADGMLLDAIDAAEGTTGFTTRDSRVVATAELTEADWTVAVDGEADVVFGLKQQINSDLIALLLFAVINLGLVGATIGTNTIVSLDRIARKADQMGDGDLSVDLSTTRIDEFGTLYDSFDRMRTSLREQIEAAEAAQEDAETARQDAEQAREEAVEEREAAQKRQERLERTAEAYGKVLSAVADGDLTRRVDPDEESEAMALVGEEINDALDGIERTIADTKAFASEVLATTETVDEGAGRVDENTSTVWASMEEIHDGAVEQNDRLRTVAAEMDELSASAEEVATTAENVAGTSEAAAAVGDRGRDAAEAAIEEMEAIDRETDEAVAEITDLADQLSEITEIVELISEIAEETNILALNASIEAARAEEGGEGFAVVAEEVKSLAEETKEAAEDVNDRVGGIQTQADETVATIERTSERTTASVETVEEAVDALEEILDRVDEVDDGIREIDDATADQAGSVQEVMHMIDELTSISEETTAEANEISDAVANQNENIDDVTDSVGDLREQAEDLDDALDRFDAERDLTGGTRQPTAADGGE